jgi:hypothetical protein
VKALIEQGRVPIKLRTDGVAVEQVAMEQIRNVASLPVVGPHVAIMPDVHWGVGATVGSVIPTRAAIIPAAVGVDLGCGMMAARTDLSVNDLAGKMAVIREAVERQIPVGGPGIKGSWDQQGTTPERVLHVWEREFARRAQWKKPDGSRRNRISSGSLTRGAIGLYVNAQKITHRCAPSRPRKDRLAQFLGAEPARGGQEGEDDGRL